MSESVSIYYVFGSLIGSTARAKFVARTGTPELEGKCNFMRADVKTRAIRAKTQLSATPGWVWWERGEI